jgi:hypothetical protein
MRLTASEENHLKRATKGAQSISSADQPLLTSRLRDQVVLHSLKRNSQRRRLHAISLAAHSPSPTCLHLASTSCIYWLQERLDLSVHVPSSTSSRRDIPSLRLTSFRYRQAFNSLLARYTSRSTAPTFMRSRKHCCRSLVMV